MIESANGYIYYRSLKSQNLISVWKAMDLVLPLDFNKMDYNWA